MIKFKKKKFQLKLPFKIRLPQLKLSKLKKIKLSKAQLRRIFNSVKNFFITKWQQFKKLSLQKKIIDVLVGVLVLVWLIVAIVNIGKLRRASQKDRGLKEETAADNESDLVIEQELQADDYDYSKWGIYSTESYSIKCPPKWYCDQVISPTQPQGPIMDDLAIFIYQDHQSSWDYFAAQMQVEENKKARIKIGEQEWEKVEFTIMDKQHQDYRWEQDGRKFTINVVSPKDKDQSQYLDLVPQILASFKVF